AERDVERPDPASDRSGQGTLDAEQELLDVLERLIGQPLAERLVRLLAGEHLVPVDLAGGPVRLADRGVEHAHARAPDVGPGAVALDVAEDGVARDLQDAAGLDGDRVAGGRLGKACGHRVLLRVRSADASAGPRRGTWDDRSECPGRLGGSTALR